MEKETLTDLQLAVMKALWAIGEGTVGDVLASMAQDGRSLAPTTVATLLQRLAKQGWVEHQKSGRQLVYRAAVGEKDAARGVLHRVLRSFFGGKVSVLAAELLESEDVSAAEIEELRRLLDKKGG
ncbi:MAG: BlaI/MecI/CopY family transcriptional regulator [Myxococcales bacterium]|nr:BlaI/MecI/CopY family transcriptional regulator [Myxococcales bacterium]